MLNVYRAPQVDRSDKARNPPHLNHAFGLSKVRFSFLGAWAQMPYDGRGKGGWENERKHRDLDCWSYLHSPLPLRPDASPGQTG